MVYVVLKEQQQGFLLKSFAGVSDVKSMPLIMKEGSRYSHFQIEQHETYAAIEQSPRLYTLLRYEGVTGATCQMVVQLPFNEVVRNLSERYGSVLQIQNTQIAVQSRYLL